MRALLKLLPLLLVAGMISCSEEKAPTQEKNKDEFPVARTKMIYSGMCGICHGEDGTRPIEGAKDLSISTLSFEERVKMITFGKGTMTPFKDRLSEEEIRHVAMYIETLRKP